MYIIMNTIHTIDWKFSTCFSNWNRDMYILKKFPYKHAKSRAILIYRNILSPNFPNEVMKIE